MTDPERETKTTDGVDRRTLLKGTAAAGMAGSALPGIASAHENLIVFESVSDEVFEYEVTVSGELHRGGPWESDSDDEIFNGSHTVRGACAEGRKDGFKFGGEIKNLDTNGPGRVIVNGDVVLDTTKEDEEEEDEEEKEDEKKKLPNKITIRAREADPSYKFRVTGRVEKGPRAEGGDEVKVIDDTVVRGSVGAGNVDNFFYSGALVFDETDAALTVTIELNRDP